MGWLLPIVLHTDADVARAFCNKRGVGRMKHLDVRHCWPLQKSCESSFPMIGCHTMTVNIENYNAVKTVLKAMPAAKVIAFLTSMADVTKS